jgi:hypothetical protein
MVKVKKYGWQNFCIVLSIEALFVFRQFRAEETFQFGKGISPSKLIVGSSTGKSRRGEIYLRDVYLIKPQNVETVPVRNALN